MRSSFQTAGLPSLWRLWRWPSQAMRHERRSPIILQLLSRTYDCSVRSPAILSRPTRAGRTIPQGPLKSFRLRRPTTELIGRALSRVCAGGAYRPADQGADAAAQFQKILDHRGIVVNYPIGALARLQLGRADAVSGDSAKAKTAYQDFLTLWKDADPDIPILKQAEAEYVKLN